MAYERIDTGKAPQLTLKACDGDLAVHAWAEPTVQAKGDYEVVESGDGWVVSGSGDLRLNVPAGASLTIGEVSGDMALKHLRGEVGADTVHGDALVADLGDVQLGTVHGDLVGRRTTGAVRAAAVHGDVAVRGAGELALDSAFGDVVARYVDGPVALGEVSGDIDLRSVRGDVTITTGHRDANLVDIGGQVRVKNVSGDIRLRGGLTGGDHSLAADGDIVVRWPAGAPLNLTAAGASFDNRLQMDETQEEDGRFTGRIGDGAAGLTLSAGGRVILKEADMVDPKWQGFESDVEFDFGFGADDIASRIEQQVNSHMARVTKELESKFGPGFGQAIAEKVARKAEKAAQRAERAADRAKQRSGGRGRGFTFDFPTPSSAPPQARKSVSMEEQLKILRMVETGTISPEEANMLLEALES